MDILVVLIVLAIVIYVNYKNITSGGINSSDFGWNRVKAQEKVTKQDKISHRRMALNYAKMFLKPYKNVMGEHCLANENCKVNLFFDKDNEKKIIGVNKHITDNKRKLFTATISKDFLPYYSQTPDYVIDFLWDTLCLNFSTETVYENVLNAVRVGMLEVQETEIDAQPQGTQTQKVYDKVGNVNIRTNNLLNINSATEAELIALPGVNVAMAKKIIKHIEKNGEFTSVDEFIEKMKIKDVFAERIKNAVCTSIEESKPTEKPQVDSSLDIDTTDNIPHTENERIIDL